MAQTSALVSRRAALVGGGAWLGAGAAIAQPGGEGGATARCDEFLAGLAVNTHIGYLDTQYRDLGAVREALRHIGVSRVRDGAPKAETQGRHAELAKGGVSFCLFWGPKQPMGDALARIAALQGAVPEAVHAIEGPNEIRPGYAYGGQTGNAAGQAFMRDLRAATQADPRLRRVPLYSFTSYERAAADCDFANHHPYPKAGKQPGELLRSVRQRYSGPHGVMPGKPMVLTEFGYHTLVGQPPAGDLAGVTPELQAALLLNGLFDAASLGITRTYLYQLFDERPDGPKGPDQEKHFGLFRLDGSPKPAAEALRILTQRLSEGGDRSGPGLAGTRIDAPAPLSSLSLTRSSGRGFVALWNESPVWNAEQAAPLSPSPATATLTLPRPAEVSAIDLVAPSRPRRFGRTARVEVEVGVSPVLVEVG